MKKAIRILVPLVLTLVILLCTFWYLFIYDREFTRDMLLGAARSFDSKGRHKIAEWFYDCAYKQSGDNDDVAIELAEQYKRVGNYTKAEYTLTKAISDGGGVDLYIALSKTFVEQDKLLDAVKMLDNVNNPEIKQQLDDMRPAAPTCYPDPKGPDTSSHYSQYITVTISAEKGTLYVTTNGEYPSIEKDLYENGITLTDGKTNIHAIAVADNGLVSPSAIFGFTVGGVIKDVVFADTAIEAAMRNALNVSNEKILRTDDLWTIKEFTVPKEATDWSDLKNLAFLEKLTIDSGATGQFSNIADLSNLKELHISGTTVTDSELALIGKLPHLEALTISHCSLSTIAGLENATKLRKLDLSSNALRTLDPLSALKLTHLNLSDNAIEDLTAISTISTLQELDVSTNKLTTLSPIMTITGLQVLSAGSNTLTDIAGIQQLTALQKLSLSFNQIADISPLAACTEMAELIIDNNAITDISVLSGLNKITKLNFSNNQVTALPKWSTDCKLVTIDGSYNKLTSLEPLKGLMHLNNVLVHYNTGIKSVKPLADCPVLIQVNVYGTKVTDVNVLTGNEQNIIVVEYDPTIKK